MERCRLTLNSVSAVALNSRCNQLLQAFSSKLQNIQSQAIGYPVASYSTTSRWYLTLEIAKRCHLSGDVTPFSDSRFGVSRMTCPVETVDSVRRRFERTVEDSDLSKSGSVGLLLLRRLVLYLFRRFWRAGKGSQEEASLCSLLAFRLFEVCRSGSMLGFRSGCSRQLLLMPVMEAERVTPVSLISLLGSVSHYKRSGRPPYWGLTPMSPGAGCLVFLCMFSGYHGFSVGRGVDPTGNAPGEPSLMPPRRRDRGRGQIPEESEGQNDEMQRSIPSRRRANEVETGRGMIFELRLIFCRADTECASSVWMPRSYFGWSVFSKCDKIGEMKEI
ncbi:putative DNA primase large subunit [Dorcoceras hygrometricum]|uniref:Putative DNA primase large subunit n=1 Tax=Dorcoceras hygrometricum TaxID=472368 RepID=A0A2Z7A664_9LAMI|nr:putative DNA primase large subunit [Dorcoceras hygrometricum]